MSFQLELRGAPGETNDPSEWMEMGPMLAGLSQQCPSNTRDGANSVLRGGNCSPAWGKSHSPPGPRASKAFCLGPSNRCCEQVGAGAWLCQGSQWVGCLCMLWTQVSTPHMESLMLELRTYDFTSVLPSSRCRHPHSGPHDA